MPTKERMLGTFPDLFQSYYALIDDLEQGDGSEIARRLSSIGFTFGEIFDLMLEELTSSTVWTEADKLRIKLSILHDVIIGTADEYNDGESVEIALDYLEKLSQKGEAQ